MHMLTSVKFCPKYFQSTGCGEISRFLHSKAVRETGQWTPISYSGNDMLLTFPTPIGAEHEGSPLLLLREVD